MPTIPQQYLPMIDDAARKYRVPKDVLAGMLWHESRFNPKAKSAAGARGIGQIMPATARELGLTEDQLDDPQVSIDASARYLKKMYDGVAQSVDKNNETIDQRTAWHRALAAYNGGLKGTDAGRNELPTKDASGKTVDTTHRYADRILSSAREMGGASGVGEQAPPSAAPDASSAIPQQPQSVMDFYNSNPFQPPQPIATINTVAGASPGLTSLRQPSGNVPASPTFINDPVTQQQMAQFHLDPNNPQHVQAAIDAGLIQGQQPSQGLGGMLRAGVEGAGQAVGNQALGIAGLVGNASNALLGTQFPTVNPMTPSQHMQVNPIPGGMGELVGNLAMLMAGGGALAKVIPALGAIGGTAATMGALGATRPGMQNLGENAMGGIEGALQGLVLGASSEALAGLPRLGRMAGSGATMAGLFHGQPVMPGLPIDPTVQQGLFGAAFGAFGRRRINPGEPPVSATTGKPIVEGAQGESVASPNVMPFPGDQAPLDFGAQSIPTQGGGPGGAILRDQVGYPLPPRPEMPSPFQHIQGSLDFGNESIQARTGGGGLLTGPQTAQEAPQAPSMSQPTLPLAPASSEPVAPRSASEAPSKSYASPVEEVKALTKELVSLSTKKKPTEADAVRAEEISQRLTELQNQKINKGMPTPPPQAEASSIPPAPAAKNETTGGGPVSKQGLTRSFWAGSTQGKITFENAMQRDLYDASSAYSKALRSGNKSDYDTANGRLKQIAARLGISDQEAISRANAERENVRQQMKGVKEGETKAVSSLHDEKGNVKAAVGGPAPVPFVEASPGASSESPAPPIANPEPKPAIADSLPTTNEHVLPGGAGESHQKAMVAEQRNELVKRTNAAEAIFNEAKKNGNLVAITTDRRSVVIDPKTHPLQTGKNGQRYLFKDYGMLFPDDPEPVGILGIRHIAEVSSDGRVVGNQWYRRDAPSIEVARSLHAARETFLDQPAILETINGGRVAVPPKIELRIHIDDGGAILNLHRIGEPDAYAHVRAENVRSLSLEDGSRIWEPPQNLPNFSGGLLRVPLTGVLPHAGGSNHPSIPNPHNALLGGTVTLVEPISVRTARMQSGHTELVSVDPYVLATAGGPQPVAEMTAINSAYNRISSGTQSTPVRVEIGPDGRINLPFDAAQIAAGIRAGREIVIAMRPEQAAAIKEILSATPTDAPVEFYVTNKRSGNFLMKLGPNGEDLSSVQRAIESDVGGTSPARKPIPNPPSLKIDNPGGEWLKETRSDSIESGRDRWGNLKRFGPVTGRYKEDVFLSVSLLEKIPGQRGEQSNVRQESLNWLTENFKTTGRLPKGERGEEYTPFIMVDAEGKPSVSEGNHRIMAAKKAGLEYLPVELRYFSGGEAVDGLLSPKIVQQHYEEYIQKNSYPADPIIATGDRIVNEEAPGTRDSKGEIAAPPEEKASNATKQGEIERDGEKLVEKIRKPCEGNS